MIDLTFIVSNLESNILYKHISFTNLDKIHGLILLKNQSKLLENYLYIGELSCGLDRLENSDIQDPIAMFLSASSYDEDIVYDGPHNIIITDLDIIDLYNKLNIIVHNYNYWKQTLVQALCEGSSLNQIVNKASDMLKSPLFILNPGYKVLYGCNQMHFQEQYGNELLETGFLSFESIKSLFSYPTEEINENYKIIKNDSIKYHLYDIAYQQQAFATIVLITNKSHKKIDMNHLLSFFTKTITNSIVREKEALLGQDTLSSTFIRDIVDEKLLEATEIENRIKFLPKPFQEFCICIVIKFEHNNSSSTPYNYVLSQVKDFFPNSNMAIYNNEIVIFYTQSTRPSEKLDINYDELSDLLARYNAYAGISNASRQIVRLRTLYQIASDTIRLGVNLHRNNLSDRIFNYEDYGMYYIIDLCAQSFIKQHHHDDLIYLTHPAIIQLCRYDKKNNTDLCDVLFYYLVCGRALSKTAQILFMHRNTVLNKLNKITEVTNISLDDDSLQLRLMTSCLIIRYYEKYMDLSLRL